MKKHKWCLNIAPIILASILLVACPQGTVPIYGVIVTKDVVYAVANVSDGIEPIEWELKDLLLDVYEPDGADDTGKPALILVHGGSFDEGSKEKEQIVEYARFFAQRGWVCFAINYRLNGDHPPAPGDWDIINLTATAHAAMVDVKAAVRYVRANAEAYGIDPNLIALLGESAGAIAGVTTAVTRSADFSTDGDEFPIPEFNNPDESARVQAYIHLWGSADHVLLRIDSSDPPTMIVHGTDDDTLFASYNSSERFEFALDLVGVPYVFYKADGFGHGAWDYRERGRGIKLLALDFLNEYLLGAE